MNRCCNVWFNPANGKVLFYPSNAAELERITKTALTNLGLEHWYTVEIPEEIYKKMLDKRKDI